MPFSLKYGENLLKMGKINKLIWYGELRILYLVLCCFLLGSCFVTFSIKEKKNTMWRPKADSFIVKKVCRNVVYILDEEERCCQLGVRGPL